MTGATCPKARDGFPGHRGIGGFGYCTECGDTPRARFWVEIGGRRRNFGDLEAAIKYAGAYQRRTGVLLGIHREEVAR